MLEQKEISFEMRRIDERDSKYQQSQTTWLKTLAEVFGLTV
jgi:hypothetical protein